jgi:hypothetical protein
MLAYLSMMAPRLIELRRALKLTGTIYLHCDYAASHYLKLLLDAIFTPQLFLNEVVWKRTYSHGDAKRSLGSVFDSILIYAKTSDYQWNALTRPLSDEHVEAKFRYRDTDGRIWQSVTLRSPHPRPNLRYPYTAANGATYQPHPNGWSCDATRMRLYDKENRLHFPSRAGGQLRLKMYLDESKGMQMQNVWDDIFPINSQAKERLGYPTQKPEALLERILTLSSKEGDTILDPFCGCGTAISVAERLKRQWIGIDITHLAITLIKHRLSDAFGAGAQFKVIGEPVSLADAQELAASDPYQFQWWALGLVGARPTEQKKGADKGIDGRLYFHDEPKTTRQIIFSVKAGGLHANYVRDLRGVIEREKAEIGVLITMEPPSQPMRSEAASAGFYKPPMSDRQYSRLQILTIADLLSGKSVDFPRENVTFKRAPKAQGTAAGTKGLPF